MSRIPEDVRQGLITEIYRRADDLDWDGLSQADRSTWYSRWLDDPAVGGILDAYMSRERARLWIKDTPMKHYVRARSGIGPYAAFASGGLPNAEEIAQLGLGDKWRPVDGTIRDKPNRCIVTDGDRQVDMIWGPPRAFQSLVWASLNAAIDTGPVPVMVVVTRQGERLTDGQVARQLRIADLVGVELRHLTVSPARRGRVMVAR